MDKEIKNVLLKGMKKIMPFAIAMNVQSICVENVKDFILNYLIFIIQLFQKIMEKIMKFLQDYVKKKAIDEIRILLPNS